jgi:oxygen-independent coproporphyrinogen-3 oxidase
MKTGIYLHIPFCRARCSYCDFNTYVGMEDLYDRYARALEKEIRISVQPSTADTIFFGGGTPSLLKPKQLGDLIHACREKFDLTHDAEITVECNPGTVSVEYLSQLREQGVNRLSFGAQSANPDELKLLGREHTFDQVALAVESARVAGFDNVNIDLIFGLPYQTLASWQRTTDAALALDPDHISLYALTIEVGTPMHDWTRRGEVPYPDPDLAADMYEYAEEAMGDAGYDHYEISNWCKLKHECEHNLVYWRNEPYFGFGAGAHSSTITRRQWNVKRPLDYIERIERGDTTEMSHEIIDDKKSRGETMMLGLRLLNEGVDQTRFSSRYGADINHFYESELARGQELGVIEVDEQRVTLTKKGRFVSNQAMTLFVA